MMMPAGYSGTRDTYVDQAFPDVSYGGSVTVRTDNNGPIQALLRFENIVGNGAGQIPPGSIVPWTQTTFGSRSIFPATNVARRNVSRCIATG